MPRQEKIQADKIKVDSEDVLRYMGSLSFSDLNVISLAKEGLSKIYEVADLKVLRDEFFIRQEEGCLDLGFMKTESAALFKNLEGCEKIILFGATIGVMADRTIQKYSLISPPLALACQAAATSLIEKWCDFLEDEWEKEALTEGYCLKKRFSPGYSDFPLCAQREIFKALPLTAKMGMDLTESLLMVPSKSVTALIGMKKIKE